LPPTAIHDVLEHLPVAQNMKITSNKVKSSLSKTTTLSSTTDGVGELHIANTHKSVSSFTGVGRIMLNSAHYDEIMVKLAEIKTSFTYLNSRYWVEYWGENDDGEILFKLYDLMDFSDIEIEKAELVFYHDIEHLFDDEKYGDSSS
jgi:hypothetical protein